MPVLIDGNNLMHTLPSPKRSREAVRQMALDLVRHERTRITLVFDGPPPAGAPKEERLGTLTVIYSGAASADDTIIRRLPRGTAARNWTVITDDRGLTNRARSAGARTSSLAAWRGKLLAVAGRNDKPDRPLSSDEIKEWENFFRPGPNS